MIQRSDFDYRRKIIIISILMILFSDYFTDKDVHQILEKLYHEKAWKVIILLIEPKARPPTKLNA